MTFLGLIELQKHFMKNQSLMLGWVVSPLP